MKIVISGAKGFIGSNLVKVLQKVQDYKLIEIDLESGIDLTNDKDIQTIEDFDIFIHLAGLSYVPDSFSDPGRFYKMNFLSTLNALELCRKNKARMVFISTFIYGNPLYLPIDESHAPCPLNPYSQSKIIGEMLCEAYNRDFNVPAIILRPFNIYGKGQNEKFLIPSIISQIKKGAKKILLKDPTPRRDFVHISDVVKAIALIINSSNLNFETFNLASNISYSIEEITTIFKKYIKDLTFSFETTSVRKGEINETVGSYAKIKKALNWEPKIHLEEGIKILLQEENIIN